MKGIYTFRVEANIQYISVRESTYYSRVQWLAIIGNYSEDPEASKKV